MKKIQEKYFEKKMPTKTFFPKKISKKKKEIIFERKIILQIKSFSKKTSEKN